MLHAIAAEASEHGRDINGLRFGMSDQWDNQAAARALESAVLREAHSMTLRPSVGDTPLFMSKEWGKLLAQFKTFAFAGNRVIGVPLAQGIAHGDQRTIGGLLALTAMGTLAYVAKQKAAGQPIETDPGRLALEVLDKSNLLGWTGEVVSPALWQGGLSNLSRWSDRDWAETIGGPTAGTIGAIYGRQLPARFANLLTGGRLNPDLPFRRSDLHFLRRMAPAQNLWYLRRGINATEDAVGDVFGLPGESDEQHDEVAAANR